VEIKLWFVVEKKAPKITLKEEPIMHKEVTRK
jgi:hypothetical protein